MNLDDYGRRRGWQATGRDEGITASSRFAAANFAKRQVFCSAR